MNEDLSRAENVVIKEKWYDLDKYSDEIAGFITDRRKVLGHHSRMWKIYEILYANIFTGAEKTDLKQHYPYLKELYNTYASTIIEACLPGYSALFTADPDNAPTVLLTPHLKEVMIKQLKSIALIESMTSTTIPDWLCKGEACFFMRLRQTTEKYREKEVVNDLESGEDLLSFKVNTFVTYSDIVFDPIDPLDLYIDAMDYKKDPRSAVKIIRSYISARELLTDKTNYPKLTVEDKRTIIQKMATTDRYANEYNRNGDDYSQSKTAANQIEVLTFMGDYVTKDGVLLTNIKAITVEGKLAFLEYNPVDTCQIIYAPYFIDRETHRGISPLASVIPINDLANKCVDLFIGNMEDVSNPILLYTAGSLGLDDTSWKIKKQLEYQDGIGTKPEFYAPPEISPNGMNLLEVLLNQQKEVLGLNRYMAGDTSGAVRTAQESQILFQKANARMRVETDVFSYNLLLPLITAFYSFNRELALAADNPLDEVYANPELAVTISTGASKADSEGELQKLMQILSLPAISQPIFQWCAETDNMPLAVRYLFSKFGLTDADNILGLLKNPEEIPEVNNEGDPEDPQFTDDQENMDRQIQAIMDSINSDSPSIGRTEDDPIEQQGTETQLTEGDTI